MPARYEKSTLLFISLKCGADAIQKSLNTSVAPSLRFIIWRNLWIKIIIIIFKTLLRVVCWARWSEGDMYLFVCWRHMLPLLYCFHLMWLYATQWEIFDFVVTSSVKGRLGQCAWSMKINIMHQYICTCKDKKNVEIAVKGQVCSQK